MKKFTVEQSREIRQWIYLITSCLGTAAYVDLAFNDGRTLKKVFGKKKKAKKSIDIPKKEVKVDPMYKVYQDVSKKWKEDYLREAEAKGTKILRYSTVKWNEVKPRFALMERTYGEDGYYYASFNDEHYYVIVGDQS